MSASSLEGVFNGFAIHFPRSFPSWQYAQTIWWCSSCSWCSSLIISQQSISVLIHAMRSWGSSPGLATMSLSSLRCTWVLTLCVIPHWIWSRKAEAFVLVTFCSSLLPVGIHCTCISRDLVPRAAKTYLRWSSLSGMMQLKEEPFLQGMPKDEERVVCIFWVPVIDGQADGCSPSCQCTSDGISCGVGRLGDELLWGWFLGHVSDAGWSDNGQIGKNRWVGYKNGCISGTVNPIDSKLWQNVDEGVLYH